MNLNAMILILYVLAVLAVFISTAAIFMVMTDLFSVQLLYYHYFIRKPVVWSIFISSTGWIGWITLQTGELPVGALIPLLFMALAVILTYKMHQESAFRAVDFPPMAEDVATLPLTDDMQLGVIEYGGVTKAYPLDYVIHYHIINDQFGEYTVSLTYCAMCRSIIPFDVTDIGPLFVGSFNNANMVVADRRTRTFFQQATFESIIGKLHPHTLTMIPFQILTWGEIQRLQTLPQVVQVTDKDFREFQLPIPGIWKKIISSEITPGLSKKKRDNTFPARTHVIGIIDPFIQPQVVYLKEELMTKQVVNNVKLDIVLVSTDNVLLCFRNSISKNSLDLSITAEKTLLDGSTATTWDLRGKFITGKLVSDLIPVAISDEYWFSWKKFHPNSELIRID